jgi:predicted ATPase
MAKAVGGQILVSDVVKAVLGSVSDIQLEAGARVRLKGFPERWRLWDVRWREVEVVPTWPALASGGGATSNASRFVGRSDERSAVERLVDRAISGTGGLLLIAGEAGLGKTRLVEESLAEVGASRVFVARGQCYDMEGAPPYSPFVEAIESALAVTPHEVFRRAMGDAGPEIARFVPKVRVTFPELPPPVALPTDQARHYMFESVGDFFHDAARGLPLVLVLEDLHWADESTTQLLESIARRVERSAMLVIGTYLDIDLRPTDPFARAIEHLVRLRGVTRMTLKRLRENDVAEIIAALSRQAPPARLVDVIFHETEGVPLFVEEVHRHLAEEGRLTDASGAWLPDVEMGEVEVPDTVRVVLGRRIDRISATAQQTLTIAACIGRAFTYELLRAVAEGSDDELIDGLQDAELARLIVVEEGRRPRFVFSHEQIRQTLLARLSFVRRQRLHRRVADALESVYAGEIDDHLTDLSFHLAAAGEGERAAGYLYRAGVASARRMATGGTALLRPCLGARWSGPHQTRRAPCTR